MIRLRQFICGLHGHDPMLHFDHQRMSLECATCGFETPGWELDGRRPRPVFRGDPQHHLLYRPTAVRTGPRRVA
jgi:hypothetical protein